MEQQSLTYFEKLERLYVLTETRKMLKSQLEEVNSSNQSPHLIEDDLHKIEQEIKIYANGHDIEELDFTTSSLINPVFYTDFEEVE
ncbi:hypothetical protein DS745_23810 [Anaerobacillus alkaliphilus]|uniref:Uncharacterized protein n=1 Tax=Anaerobacillus alkaliphilus TaxID=1548597 RepID=A0A4Q0VQR8_9BACI|nr:hypothetical protein [Anaerobacillus alkaliphilus]RXI96725.1 hypothetical protein DS745_23810 [Anaerobacillus alkaliphilus]